MPDIILERLKGLHPRVIDLSLDRVHRLLAALGSPEKALPPVIHVAGTNGKGSTLAFLRAILEAAGLRVHVYTSPHLVAFNERIRLAGAIISDAALLSLLEECERANKGAPITFFEVTTCAAFLAFAHTPADILLLETGLGGRLDATNVLAKPALTVLTPIAMDHQAYLGDTLAAIAGEKAGILKPGVDCVLAAQAPEANAVIAARAKGLGAALWQESQAWSVQADTDGFLFTGKSGVPISLPPPALFGRHQIHNAGLAIAAAERLEGFSLSSANFAQGMRSVQWPARLQRLTRGPLVNALPPDWELWLDGGHNPAAGAMLSSVAAGWQDRPLYLIFGMLGTKDAQGFLRPLASQAQTLCAVPISGETAALSAEDAALAARAEGLRQAVACADPLTAISHLIKTAPKPGRILICGSLYLAGHILRDNG